MRRALSFVLLLLVPGAALLAGLVALYRYCFQTDDRLTEETVLRIRSDAERDSRLAELVPRGRRPVRREVPDMVSRYTETV